MTEPHLVIVTGLSGAGKTTALAALEDLGFFCVDSLPTPVIRASLEAFRAQGVERIGLGVDVRVRGFLAEATGTLDELVRSGGWPLTIFYLDASDEVLLSRFSSTRRPHPLSRVAPDEDSSSARALLEGITAERALLVPLRLRSGLVWDTSELSVRQLRSRILEYFGARHGLPRLIVRIVSFGFKYGAPVDADVLFDVRFLDNPFFIEHLRDGSGLDAPVQDYVLKSPDAVGFVERAVALLEFCLPRFETEGKSYLTVGVGCTGGRHRSVAVAERIGDLLDSGSRMMRVVHRDIHRGEAEPSDSEAPRPTRSSTSLAAPAPTDATSKGTGS